MKLIIRRSIATFIDFSCILLYAGLLLGIAVLSGLTEIELSPLAGQMLGLLTLTIPVVCYFIFWEKSRYRATPGKRMMGLMVTNDDPVKRITDTALRNVLKFLPWEVAHTGLHWLFYFDRNDMHVPAWVMVVLIIPQVVMFVYLLSILLDKNGRSLYDKCSHTQVRLKTGVI